MRPNPSQVERNSAVTDFEARELWLVCSVLMKSLDEAGHLHGVDFIASGWPARIGATARRALSVMEIRGRLDEDRVVDG